MYGIYCFVRKKTGIPFVMVLTSGGAWTTDPSKAQLWKTLPEVEALLPKLKRPADSKNHWWFELPGQET